MFVLTAWTTLASADSLDLNENTWELGGSATANIVAGGDSDVYLNLGPSVGYFVADRLELLFGLQMFIADGIFGIGFFGGLDYFLANDGFAPYVGGTIGYSNQTFDFGFVATEADLVTLAGRGGVVLPFNKKVGLDLGARLNINIPGGGGDVYLHIPLGYLGIRAFFP